MKKLIWDNLKFFLTCLKNMPVSKSISLGSESIDDFKGFCVATGCESASENWVYYPDIIENDKIVNEVLKFFNACNLPFIWPLYNGYDSVECEILKCAGLKKAGNLLAMTLDSYKFKCGLQSVTFEYVTRPELSQRWAKTAWRGFGGECNDVSESFFKFALAIQNDKKNLLPVIARVNDRDAGTFLVTLSSEGTGVYYFAVVPEFRRHGIARAMMSEICRISGTGKKILLQATPSGVPFYKNFGFKPHFEIPVFTNSGSEDVF